MRLGCGKMLIEVVSWLVAVVIIFILVNYFFRNKRLASLVIAFFCASSLCWLVFDSKLLEALFSLSIMICVLFGLMKAVTDKRRDAVEQE
jgi:TctA family transporter